MEGFLPLMIAVYVAFGAVNAGICLYRSRTLTIRFGLRSSYRIVAISVLTTFLLWPLDFLTRLVIGIIVRTVVRHGAHPVYANAANALDIWRYYRLAIREGVIGNRLSAGDFDHLDSHLAELAEALHRKGYYPSVTEDLWPRSWTTSGNVEPPPPQPTPCEASAKSEKTS